MWSYTQQELPGYPSTTTHNCQSYSLVSHRRETIWQIEVDIEMKSLHPCEAVCGRRTHNLLAVELHDY